MYDTIKDSQGQGLEHSMTVMEAQDNLLIQPQFYKQDPI